MKGAKGAKMGKHRSHESPRGRYQKVDLTMTPPTARNQLLSNHHGSLSSADSSILYTASSHPTSPLLSQRSPMHQLRARNTGVNRHGVVVALEDDDDLLQVCKKLAGKNHRRAPKINYNKHL